MSISTAPIKIPLSKVKLWSWLAVTLVLLLLGIWLVFAAGRNGGGSGLAAVFTGFLLVLLSGMYSLYLIRRLFDRKPGLVIDADGVTDDSNWLAPGRIAWRDINHITERRVFSVSQRFVVIFASNPKTYINSQTHWLKRRLMWANFIACGSPFAISTTVLSTSYNQLLKRMLEAFEKYKDL